jgi:hypothetical protein
MANLTHANTKDTIWKSTPNKVGRLTSEHAYREIATTDPDAYPCGLSSLIPSIHDPLYYQGLLGQTDNFAANSRCVIFESGKDDRSWIDMDNDKQVEDYLEVRP